MGKMRNYLRHVRTTQERRLWFAADEVELRRARSIRNLPHYWWDIWRDVQRTWKKHRRTRWRRTIKM